MNIELNLDFSNCTDEEKCQALICAGLLGDPVFQNQADSTREFAICVVPGSVDELTQNLKKTHKGNVLREIKKAEEKGFGSHTFNYFNYIDDIVEIHRSKSVRGGKQISNFYRANRTEFGPKLNNRLPQEQNICAQHSIVYWGLFEPAPNPSENPSTNTEILISYIRAFRLNDIVWYNMIIGHGDCLKFGVMHKMHTDLLRHYIATEAPPKYINYGPGQVEKYPWKRKALFQNARIRFDDLSSYSGAFRESLRKPLSKRIPVYITTGEYARAEILIRLLRFYPKSGLKTRVRGTIRKVLRI